MKKGLALCMTAVLAMGCLLTGCGSSSSTATTAATTTAAPASEPAQKPLAQRQPEHRQQTVKRKHLLLVLMPASRHMVIRRMASMSVLTWIWHRKSVIEMVGNL